MSSSQLLKKALEFATRIHEGSFRKSGKPYITHPVAVKNLLKDRGFSDVVLCAAILHDVLEETDDYFATEKELYETFGDEVFFLVEALSKDNRIRNKEVRDKKYYDQVTTAMKRDPSIIFLKAADLLHNVSTLKYLSENRQNRWIKELKTFYMVNFLKNFHLIPVFHREFYHDLMNKLQEVIDKYDKSREETRQKNKE